MRIGRRVRRLETKAGTEAGRIAIVYEDETGVRTTDGGERVERGDLPAGALVIVFRRDDGGPQ